MTEKLTNRQAIGVLDELWPNPLFGEAHRQAFEIGIKAIKALEQEPCEDAISRQAVIDKLNCLGRNAFKDDTDYDNFFDFVDNFSPVTPQQKMGHWIWNVEKGYCKCSKCGIGMGHTEFDYCPNCGAKMVE